MGEDLGPDKSKTLKKDKESRTKIKDKSKEKSKEDVRSLFICCNFWKKKKFLSEKSRTIS